MSNDATTDQGGHAILAGICSVITGYVPCTYLYGEITGRLNPPMHGEGSMALALETLFIGGPIATAVLALLLGWLTYRGTLSPRTVWIIIAICAVCSAAIVRWTPHFR